MPVGILATALIALLAFAPLASATPDPVAGGTTTVNLNNKFTKYLKTFDIKVQKQGSAKVKGNKVTLNATEGSMDPVNGLGKVNLAGGLVFNAKQGKKSKKGIVAGLILNTEKKEISAKVGGKRMKFATIAGWNYARDGFGVKITIKSLKITGNAARQLNKKTGYPKGTPKPFIGGVVIGKGNSEVQPTTVAVISTGNASLNLAPSAAKKLAHVGTPPFPEGLSPVAVALAPVAPTTFDVPTLTATFPIGGGTIAPAANAGTVQTLGGLTLTQDLSAVSGDPENITTLTMGNIWVDMATLQASVEVIITNPKTPAANLGNLGRASIADISLAGATVTSDPATRTISVKNASATLQAVTAATLNQVFIEGLEKANPAFVGQDKFAAGDPLGSFSFTIQTQ